MERGTGAGAGVGAFGDFSSPQESHWPAGAGQPITANSEPPQTKKQSQSLDPACRATNQPTAVPAMEARQPAGNCRAASFPLLQGARGPIIASMSEPPNPPDVGGARGYWRKALLDFGDFLVAKKVAARGETFRQSPPMNPKPNGSQKPWTRPAPGRRIVPDAVPKRRHHSPPAMAKPSRQSLSPSAAPSAARNRRELSDRCLEATAGRVSTRPVGRGWSEGTGESRRCGRALCDFSSPQESPLARRGETRPITANRSTPKQRKGKDQALDPGLRRGDESCPDAVPETKALDAQ